MKTILICGLLMGLSATQDNPARADVYEIYSQIMANPPSGKSNERYAISAKTRTPNSLNESSFKCSRSPASAYPNRWNEVLADFTARKDKPATLERLLKISKPYFFITPEDESDFRAARNDVLDLLQILPGFRSGGLTSAAPAPAPVAAPATPDPRFQGFNEIFSLGDVYFSKDRTLALTGIATWCGGLCGSDQWLAYEKHPDGAWVLLAAGCKTLH